MTEGTALGPHLVAKRVDQIDLDNWTQVETAFDGAQVVVSGQPWLPVREVGFRPMQVAVRWTADALYVYAQLEDEDIFNPESTFNAPSFICGDVFEMFLRPLGQDAYTEIHVNPVNQKFQLQFPSARHFQENRGHLPAEWYIWDPQIESRVQVEPDRQVWCVLAEVPFALVCTDRKVQTGDRWLFSFSRYDYTHGQSRPVLSTTSAHGVANFHRQTDWGELLFA